MIRRQRRFLNIMIGVPKLGELIESWLYFWPQHVFWSNKFIEFIGLEISEPKTGFLQGRVFVMRLFGHLGRLVVADLGGEGGDQHEGAAGIVFQLGGISLNSIHAELTEAAARISQELNGVKKVMNDDRLEDVELEVPLGSRKTDG